MLDNGSPTPTYQQPVILGAALVVMLRWQCCGTWWATTIRMTVLRGTDEGAGNGQFKVPSLRNISVRAPYMHDGRFFSLEEVIDFYNSDVQPHVNLDENYIDTAGNVKALNLTDEEKAALIAYLNTLTDNEFLSDPKFTNPFF